jgi:hypothetical protein
MGARDLSVISRRCRALLKRGLTRNETFRIVARERGMSEELIDCMSREHSRVAPMLFDHANGKKRLRNSPKR